MDFDPILAPLTRRLTYQQREVFKLRCGVGDGYAYSTEEVAIAFRSLPPKIEELYRQAVKRLCEAIEAELPPFSMPGLIADEELVTQLAAALGDARGNKDDPATASIHHALSIWAKSSQATDLRATYIGWTPPHWAEMIAIEPAGNDRLAEVLFLEVIRENDSLQLRSLGRIYAAATCLKETRLPNLGAFFVCPVDAERPRISYRQLTVGAEILVEWLPQHGFPQGVGFNTHDKS